MTALPSVIVVMDDVEFVVAEPFSFSFVVSSIFDSSFDDDVDAALLFLDVIVEIVLTKFVLFTKCVVAARGKSKVSNVELILFLRQRPRNCKYLIFFFDDDDSSCCSS